HDSPLLPRTCSELSLLSPQFFPIVASFTDHQVFADALRYRPSNLLIRLSSIVVDFETPSTVRRTFQIRVSICGRLSFFRLQPSESPASRTLAWHISTETKPKSKGSTTTLERLGR
ncbi:hypothetical protein LINGRAHAP2_LOCUS22935, partial [Linum grandiflorum]